MRTATILIALMMLQSIYGQQEESKDISPEIYNAFNSKDYYSALPLIFKALETDSTNANLYYMKAIILSKTPRVDETLESFDLALHYGLNRDASKVALTYFLKGQALLTDDSEELAMVQFNKAIELMSSINDETLPYAYNSRAHIYMRYKQYSKAAEDFKMAISINPRITQLYRNLLTLDYLTNNYRDALVNLDKLTELSSEERGLYLDKANVLYNLERYRDAIDNVVKYVYLTPDTVDLVNDSLQVYLQKDFDYSLQQIDKQINYNPINLQWVNLKIKIGTKTGNNLIILSALKTYTINQDHYLIQNAINYADYLVRYGFYSRAVIIYESINNLKQEQLIGKSLYNESLILSGENRRAIKILTTLYQADSTDLNHLERRAYARYRNGDLDSALRDYDILLSQDLKMLGGVIMRGRIYKDKNPKSQEAKADFEFILLNDTTFYESQITYRAYALIELGNKTEIDLLLKYYEKNNDFVNCARIYSLLSNKQNSMRYLELALKNGFTDFESLDFYYDLKNIRQSPNFNALIVPYRAKFNHEVEKHIGLTDGDLLRLIESQSNGN